MLESTKGPDALRYPSRGGTVEPTDVHVFAHF